MGPDNATIAEHFARQLVMNIRSAYPKMDSAIIGIMLTILVIMLTNFALNLLVVLRRGLNCRFRSVGNNGSEGGRSHNFKTVSYKNGPYQPIPMES